MTSPGPGGGGGKGEESTWRGTSGDGCLELGTLQHIAQDRWSVNAQEVGGGIIRKDSFFSECLRSDHGMRLKKQASDQHDHTVGGS